MYNKTMQVHPSKNTKVALLLLGVVAIATFGYIQSFARSPSVINATSPVPAETAPNVLPTSVIESTDSGVNPTPADKLDSHVSADGSLSVEFPQSWTLSDASGSGQIQGVSGTVMDSWRLENTAALTASDSGGLTEGSISIIFQIREVTDQTDKESVLSSCRGENADTCDTVSFNGIPFQQHIALNSRQQPTITYGTVQNNTVYLVSATMSSAESALMEELNSILSSIIITEE